VQVQKSEGSGATTTAAAGGPTGAAGGRQGRQPGSGGAGVQGTVANLRGSTLYVTDSSGNTVRVKTNAKSDVVRTASSRPAAVHPGDTVIVQGPRKGNGSYLAKQVIATADGVSLFGGAGLGGGGMPPGDAGAQPSVHSGRSARARVPTLGIIDEFEHSIVRGGL
jgi:hypothetical protein